MFVIGFLLLITLIYILSFTGSKFSFDFIKEKNPHLLSGFYLPSYTSGLTFFIAVAATNLFHQGNWQRIYAAKDYKTLKKSLIGQKPKARETVRSLGLKKINSYTEREINPMIQGMINKIEHLVDIEEIK